MKKRSFKNYLKKYESKFNDYRRINEERMDKYINKNLGELPFHQFF